MPLQQAYQEFLGLLLPMHLSPIIVVPRVALILAGNDVSGTRPAYSQFGPSLPQRVYMELGEITEKEAEKLAKFFRTTIADPDVKKFEIHHNRMEIFQYYKSFYFLFSMETFEKNFLPLFKDYIKKLSALELMEYQRLSANDYLVISYKKISSLVEEITLFENKYKTKEIAHVLHQISVALQTYPREDKRMVELCDNLRDVINKDTHLSKDKKLCNLRERIFEYCSTVLFHSIGWPTPETYFRTQLPKSKCQVFSIFKSVLHRTGHKAKSIITCGKTEDDCKRLVH